MGAIMAGRSLSFPAAAAKRAPPPKARGPPPPYTREEFLPGLNGCSERHGDDLATVADRPVHASQDAAVATAALVAQHLTDEYLRAGGYAVARQPVGLPRTARRAYAVRAVPVPVLNRLVGREGAGL